MEKKNILIILGYGIILTERYRQYLKYAHELIVKNRPELVITSGGYTQQKTNNALSEAMVIASFLNNLGWNEMNYPPHIFTDSTPETTEQNLKNARDKIVGWNNWEDLNIKIVCDKKHEAKVKFFTWVYFRKYQREIISYPVCDGLFAYLQPLLTIYDIVSYFVPPLEWFKLAIKKLKAHYA